MALQTLDGTATAVDALVAFSGTSGTSMRCVTTGAEYTMTSSYQSAAVLCDGRWEDELPGKRQDFLTINNLASQGSVISDHSVLFASTNATSVTFVAATGCTKVGLFWPTSSSIAVAAGVVAMPGALILRSKGPVVTAWIST